MPPVTPNTSPDVRTQFWVGLFPAFELEYTDNPPYSAVETNTPLSYFNNLDATQLSANWLLGAGGLDPAVALVPDEAYGSEHPEFLPYEARDAIIGLTKGVPRLGSPFYLGFVNASMDVRWYGATGDYQIPDDLSLGAWSRGTAFPVSWGDGSITAPTPTHTYSSPGLYQVYATTPHAPRSAIDPTPMAMRWCRVIYTDIPTGYSPKNDSFNRTDAASLGNTDTGQPWQTDTGSAMTISTNRAACPAGAGVSINSFEGGLPNGTVEFVFKTGNDGFAVVRMVDTNNYLYIDSDGKVNTWQYGFSSSDTPFGATTAHTVLVIRNGSSFTVKKDGVTVSTFTSALYSSSQKVGVMAMKKNGYVPSMNNFLVKDVTGTTTLISDPFTTDTPSLLQTTPATGPAWASQADNNNSNGAWSFIISGGVLTLDGGFATTSDPPVDQIAILDCGSTSYQVSLDINNGRNGGAVVAYLDYNNYLVCDADGTMYAKISGKWNRIVPATGVAAASDTTIKVVMDGPHITTYKDNAQVEFRFLPEFLTGTRLGLMGNSPGSTIYWDSVDYKPNPYDISYQIKLESIESGTDTPVSVRFSIQDNPSLPHSAEVLPLQEQQGIAIFGQEYRDGVAYGNPRIIAAGWISNLNIEYHDDSAVCSGVIYGLGYWLNRIDVRDHNFMDTSQLAGYVLGIWEGSGQSYTWNPTADPAKAQSRIKYPDPTPDPFAYDPYSTGYIPVHFQNCYPPYVAARLLNGLTIKTVAPYVNTPLYHPYIPPPSQDHHRPDSVPTYDPAVVAAGDVPPTQYANSDWRDFSKFTYPPGYKWNEGLTVSPVLYAYGSISQFTDVIAPDWFDEMEGRYYLNYLIDNGVSTGTANQKIRGTYANFHVTAGKLLQIVKQLLANEAFSYYDRMDGTQHIIRKYPYDMANLPAAKGDVPVWTDIGDGARVAPGETKWVKYVEIERPVASGLLPNNLSWTDMHTKQGGENDAHWWYKQCILYYHAVALQHKAYGDAHWYPKLRTRGVTQPLSMFRLGKRPGTYEDAVKLLYFTGVDELATDPLKNTTDPAVLARFRTRYPASARTLGSVIKKDAIYTTDVAAYAEGVDRDERRVKMITVPLGNFLDGDIGDIWTVTKSGDLPFKFSWSSKKFEIVAIHLSLNDWETLDKTADLLEIDPDEGSYG